MLKAMILFPEIFGNRSDKFDRLAVWLVNMQGVVCRNIRDIFTAGGQGEVVWREKTYKRIPKIIIKLMDSRSEIKSTIKSIEPSVLYHYWGKSVDDRYGFWLDLITDNTKHMNLPIGMKELLKSK